ncbi:hypothetical protein M9458_053992 [Cirrhinus mrigala]|uniref:Uncharacterized protein n=1 Tax=Cirrhinus mrigala TaxID=683832 RepID=A0ABD0MNJ4_CIRMR
MPGHHPHWPLVRYIDFALLLSGSAFTVGIADEIPCHPPVSATPKHVHVMSGIVNIMPEPSHAMPAKTAHIMLSKPETSHAKPAKPKPVHAIPTKPKPAHVMSTKPKPVHVMPAKPTPAQIISTKPQPALVTLAWQASHCLPVWATHCTPESSSVHESAPEASSDTSLLQRPLASSDHKSVLEASPAHKFAPVPPEVSAYAVEPPKEGASIHELTASYVHEFAPEISSVHESVPEASSVYEFAPMPPEVSAYTVEPPKEAASILELTVLSIHDPHKCPKVAAPAAEPPKGVASTYEHSAHHVTAKEANHELSALLWMSFVPLWVSLLPALPAPPWLPAPPAPPWLQASQNLTWWTSTSVFHCQPLLCLVSLLFSLFCLICYFGLPTGIFDPSACLLVNALVLLWISLFVGDQPCLSDHILFNKARSWIYSHF